MYERTTSELIDSVLTRVPFHCLSTCRFARSFVHVCRVLLFGLLVSIVINTLGPEWNKRVCICAPDQSLPFSLDLRNTPTVAYQILENDLHWAEQSFPAKLFSNSDFECVCVCVCT